MPDTPSTWATNASRRGCPWRRRPIRRATIDRSPSAPIVSRARMARRAPPAVAGDDAGHRAAIVEQLLHGGALRHLGAGPPRGVEQRVVQDAAGHREARRPGRRRPGQREPAVEPAAPSGRHRGAVERGAGRLERGAPRRAGRAARTASGPMYSEQALSRGKAARSTSAHSVAQRRRGARRVALPPGPRRRRGRPTGAAASGQPLVLEAIEHEPIGRQARRTRTRMTSVPPPAKAIGDLVSVMVQVQRRSVVRGKPSASDSVTAVWRQVPSASNCQVVVQVWMSPGTCTTMTACQAPTESSPSRCRRCWSPSRTRCRGGPVRTGGFVAAGGDAARISETRSSQATTASSAANEVAARFTPSLSSHAMPPFRTVRVPQPWTRHSLAASQAGQWNRPCQAAPSSRVDCHPRETYPAFRAEGGPTRRRRRRRRPPPAPRPPSARRAFRRRSCPPLVPAGDPSPTEDRRRGGVAAQGRRGSWPRCRPPPAARLPVTSQSPSAGSRSPSSAPSAAGPPLARPGARPAAPLWHRARGARARAGRRRCWRRKRRPAPRRPPIPSPPAPACPRAAAATAPPRRQRAAARATPAAATAAATRDRASVALLLGAEHGQDAGPERVGAAEPRAWLSSITQEARLEPGLGEAGPAALEVRLHLGGSSSGVSSCLR